MSKIINYIKNNKKQVAIGVPSALLLLLLILYAVKSQQDKSIALQETIQATIENPDDIMNAGIDSYLAPTEDEIAMSEKINSDSASGVEDKDKVQTEAENDVADDTPDDDALEDESDEYANLAIAKVDNYVNVRAESNTHSEIVGKMYDGAVAQILETVDGDDGEWFKVVSGEVEGYIKAEYFIYGDEAARNIEKYIINYAVVNCNRLNIRKEPSTDSKRLGYALYSEKLKFVEDCGEWIKVYYTNSELGYVSSEFVNIEESFIYAKTIEEEETAKEEENERTERESEDENVTPEETNVTVVEPPTVTYTTNSELRNSIIAYALQFVGNRYVHGGQSLTTGTDCSGFTSLILKEYGIMISRTPQGQYTGAGRAISEEELQIGDIVCYSSNGSSCTHVAFYIGNGQIVHAANSRKGVIISDMHYSKIIGCRNVID